MKQKYVLAAAIVLLLPLVANAGVATQIIVNRQVRVERLTAEELESIFLGKMTLWPGSGSKIVPALVNEEQALSKEFIEQFLNKTVPQYRAYWKRRLFSGGGVVPRSFGTAEELIEYVSKTPGAIGFVEAGTRDERVKSVPVTK